MKRWFSLALLGWGIVCLLLSLSPQAGPNYHLQMDLWGACLDRCSQPASSLPTTAVARSTAFHHALAGPLESVVLYPTLTAHDQGPPGLPTHGPPEPVSAFGGLPVQLTVQEQTIRPSSRQFLAPHTPN
jgi:hypothetical protein